MESWWCTWTDLICPVCKNLQRIEFHLYPKPAIIYSKHASSCTIFTGSKIEVIAAKKVQWTMCKQQNNFCAFYPKFSFTFLSLFYAILFIYWLVFSYSSSNSESTPPFLSSHFLLSLFQGLFFCSSHYQIQA